MKKRLSPFAIVNLTLLIVLGTLLIGLGVWTVVIDPPVTADIMISAFNDDGELFDAVVGELEKFSGEVGVYRNKNDIRYPGCQDDHVVKLESLYFTSEEIIEETSLALLYDTVNPLFQKYDIEYLFGVEGRGQFVFEEEFARRAFLGYSKEDESQATMTVIEEVHICEGWYAIVYSD